MELKDFIHQWYLDNFGAVSGIIESIPENLRDGLADASICAFRAHQHSKETSLPHDNTAPPTSSGSPA